MNVTKRYTNNFFEIYHQYEEELNTFLKRHLGETDPRTSKWPLTSSPIPIILIFCFYCVMTFLGPRVMKSRPALEIRKILMVYNVAQIWLSFFIMKEVLISAYQTGFSFTCQLVDFSWNPVAVRMAASSWWYHISKYIDLFDTMFFILRKKFEQMSFLHTFHHSTMLFNSYLGMLYIPGGQAIVSTFLNSFVHVIMYSYYFLSAIGPTFQRYLWWKKYLTILQLTQFLMVLAHVFWGSLSGCAVPKWLKLYVIFYVSVLIVLFLNFYYSSYKKKTLLNICTSSCVLDYVKKPPKLKSVKKGYENEMQRKSKSPFTITCRRLRPNFDEINVDKDKHL